MEKPTPITIPALVFEGLEAVRRSGLTNMLDRPAVIEIARAMGYEETARWIDRNRDAYALGIFHGCMVAGPASPARETRR